MYLITFFLTNKKLLICCLDFGAGGGIRVILSEVLAANKLNFEITNCIWNFF